MEPIAGFEEMFRLLQKRVDDFDAERKEMAKRIEQALPVGGVRFTAGDKLTLDHLGMQCRNHQSDLSQLLIWQRKTDEKFLALTDAIDELAKRISKQR